MATAQVLEPVGRVIDGIQSLPWAVHLLVGAAMIAGLALWLTGRRFIRPATVLVGCAFGAAAGFVMLPVLLPTSGLSPYLGLAAGLVGGVLAGMLLYKAATALTFGSMLGAGCALLAAAIVTAPIGLPAAAAMDDGPGRLGGEEGVRPLRPVLEEDDESRTPRVDPSPTDLEKPVVRPNPKPNLKPVRPENPKTSRTESTARDATTKENRRPAETAKARNDAPAKPAKPKAAAGGRPRIEDPTNEPAADAHRPLAFDADNPTALQARQFWGALKTESSDAWESLPSRGRIWIAGAALTGLAIGTILGFMLPMWSAGAVTSLVGSAIWLPCAVWLAHGIGVPGHQHLSLSPLGWAVVWIIAALVGIAAQWRGLIDTGEPAPAKGKGKSKGKKKAKKPADDEDDE